MPVLRRKINLGVVDDPLRFVVLAYFKIISKITGNPVNDQYQLGFNTSIRTTNR